MKVSAVILVLAMASSQGQPARPRADAPSPLSTAPWRGTDELAKGWAALAAGRAGDAEGIADLLLQAGTRRHDALLLKVHARVQAGRIQAALDAYEQTLRGAATEDVYLLQPIARGTIETETHSTDVTLRVSALQALAEAGGEDAAARLAEMSAADTTGGADVALAEMGNPAGILRLTKRLAAPGLRADVSGDIEALARGGAKGAIPAIAGALAPGRPVPTRMSAARALGELDARDAIPALKQALQDPDVPVRMMAAAALARLGDASGADLLRTMETSPVADIRMMAAEASAPGDPHGAWVATATSALQDPDPTVRLGAADLLLQYASDPAAALAFLDQALNDANPAMRFAASRSLDRVPPNLLTADAPGLRRLLRDPAARVRIAAASALLRLAGGLD